MTKKYRLYDHLGYLKATIPEESMVKISFLAMGKWRPYKEQGKPIATRCFEVEGDYTYDVGIGRGVYIVLNVWNGDKFIEVDE